MCKGRELATGRGLGWWGVSLQQEGVGTKTGYQAVTKRGTRIRVGSNRGHQEGGEHKKGPQDEGRRQEVWSTTHHQERSWHLKRENSIRGRD
jgi:hypothetical protein